MKTSPFLFIGFALILYNVLGIVEAKVKADARKELEPMLKQLESYKNDSTKNMSVIQDGDYFLLYGHLY